MLRSEQYFFYFVAFLVDETSVQNMKKGHGLFKFKRESATNGGRTLIGQIDPSERYDEVG
jgi:hypothetical protein